MIKVGVSQSTYSLVQQVQQAEDLGTPPKKN